MSGVNLIEVIQPEGSKLEKYEIFLEGEYLGFIQRFKSMSGWIVSTEITAFFGNNCTVGAKSTDDVKFLLDEIWNK